MKRVFVLLVLLGLTAADARIVAALLDGGDVPRLLVARICVVAAASFAQLYDAPEVVRRSRWSCFALGGAIGVFIPVVVPLGMFCVIGLGLARVRRVVEVPWVLHDFGADLEERHPSKRASRVSAPKLASVLRNRSANSAERRFRSVLQVRALPPKVSISLLKIALKDPSDEVRLFAFSRIERFRDVLETNIQRFDAQLEVAREDERGHVVLRLAESYWGICFLGLAEGAVLELALGKAYEHALEACRLLPDSAPAQFYLARILEHRKEYEPALHAFEKAIGMGYPAAKVLPHQAECAFRLRRFEVVERILLELGGPAPASPALDAAE